MNTRKFLVSVGIALAALVPNASRAKATSVVETRAHLKSP